MNFCKKCASEQESCCYHQRITITISEINRLLSKGLKIEEILVARKYKGEASNGYWENNAVIKIKNIPYELCLKHKKDGGCLFLGNKGCTIKPDSFLCCKVYPFWLEKSPDFEYDADSDTNCPLTKLPIEKSLILIKETKQSIKKYIQKMMKDASVNKEKRKKILKHLINKGHIL